MLQAHIEMVAVDKWTPSVLSLCLSHESCGQNGIIEVGLCHLTVLVCALCIVHVIRPTM